MTHINEGARVFFGDKSYVIRFTTDGTWSDEIKNDVVEREMLHLFNRPLIGQYRIEFFKEVK